MSADQKVPGQTSRHHKWLVAVAVVVAIGLAFFLLRNKVGPPEVAEDCEPIAAQLNDAVGNLEGDQLAKADEALSELAEKFPNEPAAVRNLAICRVLALEKLPPGDARSGSAGARQAIEAAEKIEPRSPVPHVLAARMASHLEDPAAAVAELQLAAKLAPHDAVVWNELYNAGRASNDDALQSTCRQALTMALQADPTNSYLLRQQLVVQAEEHDRQILETLKTLLKQVEPILPAVKQKVRVDINATAEQLATFVEDQNWAQALAKSRLIDNAIKSEEWVKSDLRRVERHPLAYVVVDFSSTACGKPELDLPNEPRIAVELKAVPRDKQLPELEGVSDLNLSDVDLDGTIDVIALTERELTVISRKDATQPWQKSMSVPLRGPMQRLLVADLDRDSKVKAKAAPAPAADTKPADLEKSDTSCQPADVEVVVLGPAGVQLFRNEIDEQSGKRAFVPAEQNEDFEGLRNVLAGVLADIDHDGDLDLIVSAATGISVWQNLGQLKFEEITSRSALPPDKLAATSLVAVDWDRDLDIDILVAGPNDSPAGWLENLRHGSLRWRPFDSELARLSGSAWLEISDVDGNTSWDVIGAGPRGLHLARTQTEPAGSVKPLDFTEISKDGFARSLVGDFDNDAHPDLVAWGESGLKLFWGTSSARFTAADGVLKPASSHAVAVAAADLDGDGDLDLVVAEPQGLVLYDNDGGNKNHWLAVRAQGEDGDKNGDVNHLGIGSLLELKTGRKYQAQVVVGQVTHFGLGKHDSADVLRVVWTNGVPQPVVSPRGDRTLCRRHEPGGSCPYFYTWTGDKFEFCTDACWAAPLGLQLAEGVFAQPRSWEYLLIPGDRLTPKDGRYLVQMTEELWEAAYLDRMELVVVDHPADVDIFSNEKVGPPELAEFKIHTVRERRIPVAARDKHGRDVLDQIAREDGVFMKGFDAEPRRGLTDEHFLELDLGPLSNPKKVTLFLTGWLYPSSTSLNVGVSQDRSAPAPRPPALEVPDEHGNWQVVRPFMGFPGGRTKTIAVDLSDLFLADDYRLRIVTNMEFCWDAAFFSTDEDPAPLEVNRVGVASADLHYRGYSASFRTSGFGPDGYDYNRVSTTPKWAPMAGRFTRYGDVTDLLQKEDDMQVIFGSGDELTVAFDAPRSSPPAGWKRDFLLHNVGWDKDNDLNVASSQAVEPLPFHGMSGYPYRADEEFPDTPGHREYLKKYQTRTQPPVKFWRHVQQFVPEKTNHE